MVFVVGSGLLLEDHGKEDRVLPRVLTPVHQMITLLATSRVRVTSIFMVTQYTADELILIDLVVIFTI